MNYYAISDKHWERLSRILPTESSPKGGRPAKNVRTFINAIIWLLRTGSPWRALPEEFGAGSPSIHVFVVGKSVVTGKRCFKFLHLKQSYQV